MFFPRTVNKLLITWFGCGYAPIAPGTAGSIGALPLCWIFSDHLPLLSRVTIAVGITAIAILGAAQDQLDATTKDPQYIVIDEVAGMLWSTLLTPAAWLPMFVAFLLFRIFDVLKPFPANLFDRASKTATTPFRRGAHIVLDDVIAGIYATLVMQGLLTYTNWF